MQGGMDAFFYEGLGGLRPMPLYPGFRRAYLQPKFMSGVRWTDVTYRSTSGTITSRWKRVGSSSAFHISYDLRVPPNVVAVVVLPFAKGITESGRRLSQAPGVTIVDRRHDSLVMHVASGSYRFDIR